ncbi:MAG: diguanylate cyclase [bacterium]|nr:diguanylate cyclase [bacterium]
MKWHSPFSRLPIRSKLLVGYTAAFLLATFVGNALLYSVVRHAIERNIESELQVSTAGILNMVKTAATSSIRSHLRGVCESGLQIVQYHHGRYLSGAITEEMAKAEAAEDLLNLSIGETGYVYCVDTSGVLRVHPEPTLVGEDISENEFVGIQKRERTGYIEYDWANPGEETTRAKALYMTYFGPWDWIVSASSYRDEFEGLFSVDDFRDRVLSITFGETGYPYVMDSQGNLIIHPKLEGTNIYDSRDSSGRMFIREICARKNGKIVYPWRNPGEPEPREKLVIFNYIPELDWIVASSSYLEEFYTPLQTIGYTMLATVGLMLLLVLPVTWWLSTSITAPLHAIMRRFAHGTEGDMSGRLDTTQGGEIGQLAGYYNTFMEYLESSSRRLTESEENYRGLFENAAEGIFRAGADGAFLSVNPALATMLGYPNPQSLMRSGRDQGRRLLANGPPDTNVAMLLDEKGEVRGQEILFPRTDGKEVWLSINARAVRGSEGKVVRLEGFASDITGRRRMEDEQRETQLELEHRVEDRTAELSSWVSELERSNAEGALLREMGAMLQVCRQEDEAIPVVDKYLRLFFPDDTAVLYTQDAEDRLLFVPVAGDDVDTESSRPPLIRDECWAFRQGKPYLLMNPGDGVPCSHTGDSQCNRAENGSLCVPLVAQEESTGLLHIEFGAPQDEGTAPGSDTHNALVAHKQRLAVTIAEHLALALSNLKLRETLRIQSIQDPLTGLFNRRYLEESMGREMSRLRRQGTSIGVIMADLDHFKRVNDSHGHEAGDAVLCAFGDFLRTQTRCEDIACRLGGEEFAIVLMDASIEATRAKAQELCDGVRDIMVRHEGEEIRFTISMGVAGCPVHGESLEEALQAADKALYQAKERGRDRVAVSEGGVGE